VAIEKREKGNVVGVKLTVNDLVSYQVEAVVSRSLVDKKTGTVTVFSFDENQGLSEHTAPYDAMVQIIDGEAEITISGRPFRLSAGEMIITPAGHPHALRALSRFKMVLTMIRSEDTQPKAIAPG
jgi:quercetin dioxygenase-like cupin family protein